MGSKSKIPIIGIVISLIFSGFITFFKMNNVIGKTKIPIELWTFALQFWYKEHPKEIEKYGNIQELKKK